MITRWLFFTKIISRRIYLLILAFIICVYEEPVVPEQAAIVTEKLGDYLIQVGF